MATSDAGEDRTRRSPPPAKPIKRAKVKTSLKKTFLKKKGVSGRTTTYSRAAPGSFQGSAKTYAARRGGKKQGQAKPAGVEIIVADPGGGSSPKGIRLTGMASRPHGKEWVEWDLLKPGAHVQIVFEDPGGRRVLRGIHLAGSKYALPPDLEEYRDSLIEKLDSGVFEALRKLGDDAPKMPPAELAELMVDVVPAPAPANKMAEQVGPTFYDTTGVMVVLAEHSAELISKQAVDERRKRRSVLALKTADGRWIYPTWQFNGHAVIPGLADVLAVFDDHPTWSVATWLTTPSVDFDGLTAVQWLKAGQGREHLLRVARHAAGRWAA